MDIGIHRKKCTIQKHEMNRNNNNKFLRCLSLRRDKMPCAIASYISRGIRLLCCADSKPIVPINKKTLTSMNVTAIFSSSFFSPRFGMHIEHMQIIFILYEIARIFSKPSKKLHIICDTQTLRARARWRCLLFLVFLSLHPPILYGIQTIILSIELCVVDELKWLPLL